MEIDELADPPSPRTDLPAVSPSRPTDCLHLAIESSGRQGSLALLRGGKVLRQTRLTQPGRTAATMAPALQAMLRWSRSHGHEVAAISVAAGPGSFTGLRIAVTTAKTLSYALRVPLVAVDSLAAIAATALHDAAGAEQATDDSPTSSEAILVAVGAYRGRVFVADVPVAACSPDGPPLPSSLSRVLEPQVWADRLTSLVPGQLVAGERSLFEQASRPPTFLARPSADAVGVGRIAWASIRAGRWDDPIGLVPNYLRPSAAEETSGIRDESVGTS